MGLEWLWNYGKAVELRRNRYGTGVANVWNMYGMSME
jgi:hypothetical protein